MDRIYFLGLVAFFVGLIFLGPKLLLAGLPAAYERILDSQFTYYQRLSKGKKRRFNRKLKYFIRNKEFIPMHMDEVSIEMRVLISATAVQLTFGLPFLKLPLFPKILVFPNKFKNKITGKEHVGEVNNQGIIALSWQDFHKGISNDSDAMNVGLHELAHALEFEDAVKNEEHGFLSVKAFKKIRMYFEIERVNVNNGKPSFFRKYALVNDKEFFAVGVEYFFEKPREFQSIHPDLYRAFTELLNQDPIKLYRR